MCVANIHANAHCDFNADRDCACISDGYCNSYRYIHNHTERYGNGHSYSYGKADAHCTA